MEVALGLEPQIAARSLERGFNPCFRGSRPRTSERSERVQPNHDGFNPCFRGSRPRTPGGLRPEACCYGVSILVFVEVALGLQIDLQDISPIERMFQSLFSWKSPSDPVHRCPNDCDYCGFQSLFSWKSPSDITGPDGIEHQIDRFNPCFRGSRPRTGRK